jgi:hypothetical protein
MDSESCRRVREGFGGAERDRTAGLLVANEALSQLSYSPTGDPLILPAKAVREKARNGDQTGERFRAAGAGQESVLLVDGVWYALKLMGLPGRVSD